MWRREERGERGTMDRSRRVRGVLCARATDREKRKERSTDGWEGAGWMDKRDEEEGEQHMSTAPHNSSGLGEDYCCGFCLFFNGCTGQKLLENVMHASTVCIFLMSTDIITCCCFSVTI